MNVSTALYWNTFSSLSIRKPIPSAADRAERDCGAEVRVEAIHRQGEERVAHPGEHRVNEHLETPCSRHAERVHRRHVHLLDRLREQLALDPDPVERERNGRRPRPEADRDQEEQQHDQLRDRPQNRLRQPRELVERPGRRDVARGERQHCGCPDDAQRDAKHSNTEGRQRRLDPRPDPLEVRRYRVWKDIPDQALPGEENRGQGR